MLRLSVPIAAFALALLAGVPALGQDPGDPYDHIVKVRSFEYEPAVVVASPGDWVAWQIEDTCHSVTEGLLGVYQPQYGFDSDVRCANLDPTAPPDVNIIATRVVGQGEVFTYYCKVGMHALMGQQGVVVAA